VELESSNIIFAEGFAPTPAPLKVNQSDFLADKVQQSMCEILLESNDFFNLMVRVMYRSEMKMVESDEQIKDLLDALIKTRPEQVSSLFIDKKLILFLLNIIFDSKHLQGLFPKETRANLVKCVLKIEQIDKMNNSRQKGVLQAFIPPNFFAEIKEILRRNQAANDLDEKLSKFLDDFDADNYESVFVKWNKTLRQQNANKIREYCDKIASGCDLSAIDLRTLEEVESHDIKKEQIADQIILRMYNRNPSVFINQKLTAFITNLAERLYFLSQELYELKN
jgi:DNA-directed RNA polymerase subunit F